MSQPSEEIAAPGTAERAELLHAWLGGVDADSASWEADLSAVSMLVVDSLLHGDAGTLAQVPDPVRDALAKLYDAGGRAREIRGYLLAVLAVTRLGLERLPDPLAVHVTPDSHAAKALTALAAGKPLSSNELQRKLGTSASQVSRVGRQLLADGLVVQRRSGRTASWEITPRGRLVAPTPSRSRRRAG